MEQDRNKIEAILFTTGQFLTVEEISKMCGIGSIGYIKGILGELKDEYNKKESALEIVNEKDKWRLNIKKDYMYLTEKLLTDAELDMPTQETLAVVAYKQPAVQSVVIKTRGNKAYDHIKNFVSMGLIHKKKTGHTHELTLSDDFYDYFAVQKNGQFFGEGKGSE